MQPIRIAVTVASIVASSVAYAGYFLDGNDLKQGFDTAARLRVTPGTWQEAAFAERSRAYVLGVVDGNFAGLFCLPPSVTVGQITAVVEKHLNDNPGQWNLAGSTVVTLALSVTFPCATLPPPNPPPTDAQPSNSKQKKGAAKL